jgi:aryl-alcohol dehydrogenase-like predicted oxidoreductase
VRGGGEPRYLRQTCEQSLKNLGIETLDVFCMSRVDPNGLSSATADAAKRSISNKTDNMTTQQRRGCASE